MFPLATSFVLILQSSHCLHAEDWSPDFKVLHLLNFSRCPISIINPRPPATTNLSSPILPTNVASRQQTTCTYMGQSASTASATRRSRTTKSTADPFPIQPPAARLTDTDSSDCTFDLPDECLACIFQSLPPADRKRCSLVCHRWLKVEGQSRHRLSLDAQSDLHPFLPSILSRFDSVTKLSLKCDRRSASVGDDALVLISLRCTNLTRLKLRACRQITNAGIEAFSNNCRSLKKLSCGSCTFGARGLNAVLDNCPGLEELSVKRLRGITTVATPIGPGVAAKSMRVICLKELYNGQCFGPLIIGSESLKTLKLFRCSGDWDRILPSMAGTATGVAEVHLERVQVSDVGLKGLSLCAELEILHLVKTPDCTNAGLVAVAERCRRLRKLHMDGCRANRIGDEGLIAVAKNCPELQELLLVGINPTRLSLGMLAESCVKMERLALCGSDTVGDVEISCIAAKCVALKRLCIKNCPVSDHGMEALAGGCPNLVKVKVKKCPAVTFECAHWLRAIRGSLAVNLDTGEGEAQRRHHDNGGNLGNGGGGEQEENIEIALASGATSSSSGIRSASIRSRLCLSTGRNLVACRLRRWASTNSRDN
ncbi:Putative VIER F-box protein 1 [Dionaea muscipula]